MNKPKLLPFQVLLYHFNCIFIISNKGVLFMKVVANLSMVNCHMSEYEHIKKTGINLLERVVSVEQ